MRSTYASRIAAVGLLALLFACDDGDDGTGPSREATRLEIRPAEIELRIGEKQVLSVAFLDGSGREVDFEGTVQWSSGDEAVVAVDAAGAVRGVSPGTAGVTASSGSLSATADVRVRLPAGEPQAVAAATETIGPEGGAVSATGKDGTRYTLRIPAGAVEAATAITLTPLERVDALPLTGGFAVGVDFAPDGLTFRRPAELEIVAAVPSGTGLLVGFSLDTEAFRLKPALLKGDTLRLTVPHFSSVGAATGTAEEVGAVASQPGTSPEEQFEATLAQKLAEARPEEGGQADPDELLPTLVEWYETVVAPALASAQGDAAEAAIAAFIHWWESAALLGVDDPLHDQVQAGLAAVASIIAAEIDRLNAECGEKNDPSLVTEILGWSALAGLMGLDTPGSGLAADDVLEGLCQQVVIRNVVFPDTIKEGEEAELELIAGLAIGDNAPTFDRPVEVAVTVIDGGATVTPNADVVGSDGRFTATVIAHSDVSTVRLEITATALDLPLPPATVTVEAVVDTDRKILISPEFATAVAGGKQEFVATVVGIDDQRVQWSTTGGSVSTPTPLAPEAVYRAPNEPGVYQVIARSFDDASVMGTAEVEVVPGHFVEPLVRWRIGTVVYSSRASVWAGTSVEAPEDQLLSSYTISTSSDGGTAELTGRYEYEENESLRSVRYEASFRELPETSWIDSGNVYVRTLLRIGGKPVDLVVSGSCDLIRVIPWRGFPPDPQLVIRVHNEPVSAIPTVDHRITVSPTSSTGCHEEGWSTTFRLDPGFYLLTIDAYDLADADYDLTFTFVEVEDEEEAE